METMFNYVLFSHIFHDCVWHFSTMWAEVRVWIKLIILVQI